MTSAERVVLLGAGDHGRGVLEIFRRHDPARWNVLGFVDDAPGLESVDGVPILGNTAWLEENLVSLDASVLFAIANSEVKKKLAGRFDALGARYASVVHPAADIAPTAKLGPGCVVNAGVMIVYEADIGAHVTVNLSATVGHHVCIGDYTTVAPTATILGKVKIGAGCQINANSTILPGLSIGDRAIVGAGAVVLKDVPPDTTVFGNPARPVPRM